MRVLLWLLLVGSLLLCAGCRQRDGLVDTGPVMVDPRLMPDNLRCPMPPRPNAKP